MPYKDKEKEKERCRKKYLNNKTSIRKRARELRLQQILDDPIGRRRNEASWNLKAKFGITVDGYERMLDAQGGVCQICHRPPGNERLCVDHNHSCCRGVGSCGKCIRGLICRRCNSMLGFAEDNVDRLRNAVEYLERAKA